MILATREIDRYSNIKDEKEYIHITNEQFEAKDLNEKEIEEFYNESLIDNDSEENYFNYGIVTGWDSELYKIEVEKLIDGLAEWIESEKEFQDEDDTTYYYDLAIKLKKDLEKYKDYELIFKEESEKK